MMKTSSFQYRDEVGFPGGFGTRMYLRHGYFHKVAAWSAPPELAHVVQEDAIEHYIQDDGMIVADYDLKTHHVRFTTHEQPGFVGTCMYHLRKGSNEATTPETPLTVRQQILLLAQLAFYCGVGHKTSMGLGQVRPRSEKG